MPIALPSAQVLFGMPARGLGHRVARWRRHAHAGTARLRESDRDRLFGRPGAVLAFADVVELFTHELAGLRAGRLPLAAVAARALQRLLLRHIVLLRNGSEPS